MNPNLYFQGFLDYSTFIPSNSTPIILDLVLDSHAAHLTKATNEHSIH